MQVVQQTQAETETEAEAKATPAELNLNWVAAAQSSATVAERHTKRKAASSGHLLRGEASETKMEGGEELRRRVRGELERSQCLQLFAICFYCFYLT